MPYPKNQVERTCEICGKVFSVKASAKSRRFCSWECRKQQGDQTKVTVNCAYCGKPMQTYKSRPKKYCSISCGISARNLTEQNPSYHRDITGENNPMYGKGLHGSDNPMYGKTRDQNPMWKGGRKVRKDGYILVAPPEGHPCNTQYILEHRLVMEQHLGRYLESYEVVHHIDGNTSNNDVSNLRLYSSQSEHISHGHSAA